MKKPISQGLPVVLVDDEAEVLFGTSILLKTFGIGNVHTMEDGRDLLAFLEANETGMVVLDLTMPHISGTELLPLIIQNHPQVPVVVMAASQEVETAVQCMKEGAFDYLLKPTEESRLISSVQHALEVRSLRRQVNALTDCLLDDKTIRRPTFSKIITNHPKMESIFRYIEAISESSEPILITGETGVGKGILAEAVHEISLRPGELVSINVAGLDDTMFSETLFGHQRGAFSGTDPLREGLVAKAGTGTLMLDEMGDLSQSSQVKLLRLLQERNYYPLGSDLPRVGRVRVIATTNQDLGERMAEQRFRPDLFFRLSSHRIEIPPLRDRIEDIPLLVNHFLMEAGQSLGKPQLDPPSELFTLLSSYHFPGNIRELRAMIFDAVARHQSGQIISLKSFKHVIRDNSIKLAKEEKSLPVGVQSSIRATGRFPTLKEAENLLISEALRQTGGNQGIAALLLGVSRPALNRRLMRLKAEELSVTVYSPRRGE